VVLPRLQSVELRSVYNWTIDYEKQIKQVSHDIDALRFKIKALYKDKDAIPMEELARELKNLLTNPIICYFLYGITFAPFN
jgi:regulator of replication initiation timing